MICKGEDKNMQVCMFSELRGDAFIVAFEVRCFSYVLIALVLCFCDVCCSFGKGTLKAFHFVWHGMTNSA